MALVRQGLRFSLLTTNPSASLAVDGEVKRGHRSMEPKAHQTCGGEAPTARSEFFTASPWLWRYRPAWYCTVWSAI